MSETVDGVIRVDWSVDSELSSSDEEDYIILGEREYPVLNTDEDIEDEEEDSGEVCSAAASPVSISAADGVPVSTSPIFAENVQSATAGEQQDTHSATSSEFDDSVANECDEREIAGGDSAVNSDLSTKPAHVFHQVNRQSMNQLETASPNPPDDLFSLLRRKQHEQEAEGDEEEGCDLDDNRCEVCGYQAENAAALEGHVRTAHIEACGPFQCGQCSYTSNYRYQVRRHSKLHMDMDQRPHRCRMCGRGFVRRKGLIIHERTHTGERPYVCRYCERDFADKSNLLRHIRAHHGDQVTDTAATLAAVRVKSHSGLHGHGQGPYACSVCDRRFSAHSYLLRHMRAAHIHTMSAPKWS